MNAESRPVIIAAGGTGGHVFPALAVADVLRERDIPVVWVGTQRGLEAKVVPDAGIPVRWISVVGLRGKGLLGRIVGPIRLALSIVQCVRLMLSLKPRAVLGMGGYVTGPVGIAAKITGSKLVLHEQNAVAGMTNKRLAPYAAQVFSAMPNAFSNNIDSTVVGNPLRRDIEANATHNTANNAANDVVSNTAINSVSNAPKNTEEDNANNTTTDAALKVLIVGGSQGAQVLNNVVPEALKRLNFSIKLVHQSGLSMYETVQDRYASHTPNTHDVDVKKFIDNMTEAYQWADLVICRSGAMTVSELAAMSLPSVLVPFPHAVDDHQTKNAKFLEQQGAAVVIPQPEFTEARVAAVITEFNQNRTRLTQMGKAARTAHRPAAAEKVADALLFEQGNSVSSNHEVSA